MKILKNIGLALLALLVLMLLIGLVQPTTFSYERHTVIDAPQSAVFAAVNDLETWEEWGPWKEEDPTMEVTYYDQTVGEGAGYSWTGEEAGTGTMVVTEANAPTHIMTALTFDQQDGGNAWFNFDPAEEGGTKTTWAMEFEMPYPINAISLFTAGKMEEQMNEMFDRGLANLKTMVEANQGTPAFAVQEVDFPGRSLLVIKKTMNFEEGDMQGFFADSYAKIGELAKNSGAEMAGSPSALYYTWDEETKMTDMAAAMPVTGATAGAGEIELVQLPASKAFLIEHYGSYEGLGAAHYAMDAHLKAQKVEVAEPVMEEYVTDPGQEPDASKWLTRIYYFPAGPIAEEQ